MDVYAKYFEEMPKWDEPDVVDTFKQSMAKVFEDKDIGELGSSMMHLNDLKGDEFIAEAIKVLQQYSQNTLNYTFKNPMLLLAALTHPSAKSFYRITGDYEKLEALGDAILDYVLTINMIRYTMFERY
jgi:hypothetical protein